MISACLSALFKITPLLYLSILFVISLYGFHKVLMIWRFYKYAGLTPAEPSYSPTHQHFESLLFSHTSNRSTGQRLSFSEILYPHCDRTLSAIREDTLSAATQTIVQRPTQREAIALQQPFNNAGRTVLDEQTLPNVTIQLPIFNELYVAERLLDAVGQLRYPQHKLEIQVLDDSTDETQILCQNKVGQLTQLGCNISYFHRSRRKGFKAGALAEGLRQASGELIMIFDADFMPTPDILFKLVGHFNDPQVGMVQARWTHLNRQYSLLTQVQALMLDGHFVIEQTARHRAGCFFNFNGTAGMWRLAAITDAGGWEHTTVTEDLDLSYRAQLKGWKCIYLPQVAIPAELPVEMNSFKSQQFRWAKGASQVTRKLLGTIVRSPMPFYVKAEAFLHLTNNFNYLLLTLLLLLSLPYQVSIARYPLNHGLLIYVPIFLATTLNLFGFYWVSQKEQAQPLSVWQFCCQICCLMGIGVGLSLNQSLAVCDGLINRNHDFIRTPKHGVVNRSETWRGKKYRGAKTWIVMLEALMLLYLAVTMATAVYYTHYLSLPFLLLFFSGYAYILGLGLFQRR